MKQLFCWMILSDRAGFPPRNAGASLKQAA